MLTTEIENFPGFPEGIMGPELMGNFRSQAERFGAEMITEKVTKVDFSSKPFKVWVRDTEYTADSIIVATGAQSLMLDLPREGELIGHGVSTCATCDGFFFRGHEIAVVGGGDSAIEEANFLTKFASKVYLVVRRDALRASRIMQQRALDNPKIEILWNSRVSELHGEGTLSGVTITDTVTNESRPLAVTGLFIAIGHKPNTGLFTNILDMEETGYLLTREGSTYTNVPGIFACGDVQDHTYRQAITAAGSYSCTRFLSCAHRYNGTRMRVSAHSRRRRPHLFHHHRVGRGRRVLFGADNGGNWSCTARRDPRSNRSCVRPHHSWIW